MSNRLTEYVDCVELKRLISDKKIKPVAVKSYLRGKGMFFTASNSAILAEQIYTIFFGTQDMAEIRDLILYNKNYEKSTLLNLKLDVKHDDEDILDIFIDEVNNYKQGLCDNYDIGNLKKEKDKCSVCFSYQKKLLGKNKLLEYEKRDLVINLRKISEENIIVDIRHSSSTDFKFAEDFLEKVVGSSGFQISHINLNLLTDENKVLFFDLIASHPFEDWKLKSITGLTVKQGNSITSDEDEDDLNTEIESEGTLSGISQAVLNGSGLRTNEFVQKSIEHGYYIVAMRYRYVHKRHATEMAILIKFKKNDLQIEIDKTYIDEDGKVTIQPFLKFEQDQIIVTFQNVANQIYHELLMK